MVPAIPRDQSAKPTRVRTQGQRNRGGGTGAAEPGRSSVIAGKVSPHSATGLNDSESRLPSSSCTPQCNKLYIAPDFELHKCLYTISPLDVFWYSDSCYSS
jgi:hypothetical protein